MWNGRATWWNNGTFGRVRVQATGTAADVNGPVAYIGGGGGAT
jgi:hypothetical protein